MNRLIEIFQRDLPAPGERKLLWHDAMSIVLFNLNGSLHAIENSCPHSGASLFAGKLQGNVLQCPAHGFRFQLSHDDGVAPAMDLKRYPVIEDGDRVLIIL